MATIFFNHLRVTGPTESIDEFVNWCGLNPLMIDVDDGASDAAHFDESVNYENHKNFMDFIKRETDTRVDRIRLFSDEVGGMFICMDSWNSHLDTHTHWMARNCPALKFDVAIIQDPHWHYRLIFVDGKWVAYSCDAEPPLEEDEDPRVTFVAAGYVDDYSDNKFSEGCDRDSLDADVRRFVDSYQLEFGASPWVKTLRRAEEEINDWEMLGQTVCVANPQRQGKSEP